MLLKEFTSVLERYKLYLQFLRNFDFTCPCPEIDNEGVIEPDTDEPQEMGDLEVEVRL